MAALTFTHVQQRDGRWCIVDLLGKHGRIRTIPMPTWVKVAIDAWAAAAGVTHGAVFRPVSRQPAREKSVVASIMRLLREEPGVVVRKRHSTAMGVAGGPDLYGSIRGRHFEIEVKRPDGSSVLTELQRQSLRKWELSGAIVGVARSVDEAVHILGLAEPDRGRM